MRIFRTHDKHTRQAPGSQIQKKAGLRADIFGLVAVNCSRLGLNLTKRDLT